MTYIILFYLKLFFSDISYVDHIFSILSSITIIIASIIGLSIGSFWKRQDKNIKEKGLEKDIELKKIWRDNEICVKAIKSLKFLNDKISYFRSPFMSSNEILSAYKEGQQIYENKEKDIKKDQILTYNYRWEKVRESLSDFESVMVEVRILFEEIDISKLKQKINELYNSLIRFNNIESEVDKEQINNIKNIIGIGHEGVDIFQNELSDIIKNIEKELSKYIIK